MNGIVKTFYISRGFGFIEIEDGDDVFFHITEIQDGIEPIEGTEVSFDTEETIKGLSATNVKILE